MSGSRQKQLRRQSQFSKTDKIDYNIRIRKLMNLPVVPKEDVIEFLLSRFIGKTGYHYISVSAYGSFFINDNYKDIVPVILHQSFPVTSAIGRFEDPNKKDCAIRLVEVNPGFKGIILGRDRNVYSAGIQTPITREELMSVLSSLGKPDPARCNAAIRSQEAEFCKRFESVRDRVEQDIKRIEALDNDPYADPYDISIDPYETETPL